jgi:hypothetical protein
MYVGRVLETVALLQRCLGSKRNNTIVVLHVHVYLYLHVACTRPVYIHELFATGR